MQDTLKTQLYVIAGHRNVDIPSAMQLRREIAEVVCGMRGWSNRIPLDTPRIEATCRNVTVGWGGSTARSMNLRL
jgi:hypothetical protein